jgi:membrane protein implicated in regulation of membrane protease activity
VSAPARRRSRVLWLYVSAVWIGLCAAIWPLPLWRFGSAILLVVVLVLIVAKFWDGKGTQ